MKGTKAMFGNLKIKAVVHPPKFKCELCEKGWRWEHPDLPGGYCDEHQFELNSSRGLHSQLLWELTTPNVKK